MILLEEISVGVGETPGNFHCMMLSVPNVVKIARYPSDQVAIGLFFAVSVLRERMGEGTEIDLIEMTLAADAIPTIGEQIDLHNKAIWLIRPFPGL